MLGKHRPGKVTTSQDGGGLRIRGSFCQRDPGSDHAVVSAQGLVAARLVRGRIAREVAERRRQAVGAVLARHASQRPKRVLQAGGECREALAAEYDLGVALLANFGICRTSRAVVSWSGGV